MGTIMKVAIVVVLVAVLFMTSTESRGNNRRRKPKSNQITKKDNTKRNDGTTKRNKAKTKEWLKDATDDSQFRIVKKRTKELRDVLNSSNVAIANITSFSLIKTCEKLFSKFNFRTNNYQKGQGDLLGRMRLFRNLLVKATGCLEEEQGDKKTVKAAKNLNQSLASYVKNVTVMCKKECRPSEKELTNCTCTRKLTLCGRMNRSCPVFFNVGEQRAHRNQNTYNEQLQIISTKLKEFLDSIQSRKKNERKKKRGKGKTSRKGKKVRTYKKLKKIFHNMARHGDLTSWKRRCKDDSIQLILTSKRSTDSNVTGPFEQYCPAP